MKIQVTGERPVDAISVTGGQQPTVIDVTAGTVFSVNGHTGAVTVDASDVGAPDWINAAKYGATGSVTDDTPYLQAAINATPSGGICYLPTRQYRTSAPLVLPPGVTLLMPHSNLMVAAGLTDPPCSIKPLPTFTGNAVIVLKDQTAGGYSTIPAEHRLINVMIDGGAHTATTVDGISAAGNIQNVVLAGVTVRYMTGNGIYAGSSGGAFPYSWRMRRVMLDNNHGHGFNAQVMTDLTAIDCEAIGNWANGWEINNAANSQLIGCRAEWSGNHGFHLTGDWGTGTGSGGMLMSGCSTDRNGWNGVLVDATGNAPIQIENLHTRRDGRNGGSGGGGYAGLAVNGATVPVLVGLVTCYPGVDDGGAGTNSPQYGARFSGSSYVSVASGFLHAATAGWSDGGGNTVLRRGPNIGERTGTTASPTNVYTQPWTAAGALTAESFNTDGTVRSGNFRTNSNTEHALTVYQRATGTSPGSVALNVISDKPGDSAMWLTGHELARGTFKVAHLNPGSGATADASAAAISIDLQWNGQGGTAAQGIFLTATEGPTTGNLITLRNAASPTVEEFCVRGSGLSGFQLPVGNTPQGTLEVRQKDVNTIAQVVQGMASSAVPIAQFKNSGGTATFEIGASGAIVTRATAFVTGAMQLGSTSSDLGGSGGAVISMKDATTAPTTNPTAGVIAYSQGGVFKTRSSGGVVFDTTRRTVTGSRGGNAALASLLTQLASTGLITDSSSA